MKGNLVDREFDKFVEDTSGNTAVRTLIANQTGQEIPVSGNFSASFSPPTGPIKNTTALVTDVAANPLPIPQNNRVSLSIRNKDAVNTIYIGGLITVTADDSATGGWEIGPGEDFNLDLDSSNVFFLIAQTGKTATVKILEIASASAGGGGGMAGTAIQEQLTGVVDGSNPTFITSYAPLSNDQFILFVNGIFQTRGIHYTRVGTVVTMISIPQPGQSVEALYWY